MTANRSWTTMLPDDDHNRRVVGLTHPPDHVNPAPASRYNLVVIGGGTAGLVSAIGAAGLGARVALVERGLLGGDCLNTGCVPSKALLRVAKAAKAAVSGERFGVTAGPVRVDFEAAMEWVRASRATVAPHDAAERVTGAGVDLFLGEGRFTGPDKVAVGDAVLPFARAVVATGGRAVAPPIPGLKDVPYLTNETIFELTSAPDGLLVVGAGPIGCELSQAFRRLGVPVTLATNDRLLPRDDGGAADHVRAALADDGVELLEHATVTEVAGSAGDLRATITDRSGTSRTLSASHLLIATGRRPNTEGLGLEQAGVATTDRGVTINEYFQTTNPHVYAAGDVAGLYQFTHAADQMARFVLRNALFLGRARTRDLVIPWVTYTDPEVAHVGKPASELAADETLTAIDVDLADNDRNIVDGERRGFGRAWVDGRGRLAGATLVGPSAGNLIGELCLVMTHDLSISALASTVHPYPTEAELLKKLGDSYNRTRLTPTVKGLMSRFLGLYRL